MKKLKDFRLMKGLTQEELADKMAITRQTVGNWEKGISKPDANEVKTLSKILEVDESELMDSELVDGRGAFYADLIESNTEYALLPKAVLKDYKIVPDKILDIITKSNEGEKQALIDKYEKIITGLENRVKKLKSDYDELSGKITSKNKE